ncbi:MAG: ATP-binding protein [Minicystis sp.]
MLKRIVTHDVEPADLDVSLAPRLNLLAGDNGLGKTFLLDLAWWALATDWAVHQVIPRRVENSTPAIRYWIESIPVTAGFDFRLQAWEKHWPPPPERDLVFGRELALYGRADGGFLVQDSLRHFGRRPHRLGISHHLTLSVDELWNGKLADDGTVLCNGLIRDWIAWQFQKPAVFDLFARVLAKLSPRPDEIIRPGPPRRVSIEDARDIPTILLPYGQVPITHASAGMRRVLALAYVLVWTWYEHTEAARLQNRAPLQDLVLLVDEVDAHLHPTWQRVILPALFEVFPEIERSLRVQVIASTHAPLVLASVETLFDEERDRLLHFALRDGKIAVDEIPWAKQGDAVNWLVSEAFGLQQGRSRDAERAIEAAEAFMRHDPTPPDLDTREKIHAELLRVLPGHDDFWPRWLVETGAVG